MNESHGTLIMGSPEAEAQRELDHRVLFWLVTKHPCPLCYDVAPEDVPSTLPEPGCRLCDGTGEVTGEEIEEWALSTKQTWLLPSWFPVQDHGFCRPDDLATGGET